MKITKVDIQLKIRIFIIFWRPSWIFAYLKHYFLLVAWAQKFKYSPKKMKKKIIFHNILAAILDFFIFEALFFTEDN